MRLSRAVLVCTCVVLGVLAGGVAAAQAAERQCVGLIGPETVRGDLVVPAGQVCDLAGTRVRGNVYVREGAELYAEQADIRGSIEAAAEAYVDLFGTTVGGSIALRSSLGASVEGGSINGNLESAASAFVDLFTVSIGGNLKAEGAETAVFGEDVEIGGTMAALGVDYMDLYDSTVNGDFFVRSTQSGSIFCGNTLNGNAEFTGNRTLLTIGSPDQACAGNDVGGSVKVEKNQAEAEISDNDIGGNLACFDNTPPPTGAANRVEGNKEGQCRTF
jgi:hypothetical protein